MLRKCLQVFIGFITCAWASLLFAAPTVCTMGDLTRSVEVVYTTPGQSVPCEVLYSKPTAGTVESLWRANNETGYCENKAKQLINNLADMGWQCEENDQPVDATAEQ
jgi:hypothetical protein